MLRSEDSMDAQKLDMMIANLELEVYRLGQLGQYTQAHALQHEVARLRRAKSQALQPRSWTAALGDALSNALGALKPKAKRKLRKNRTKRVLSPVQKAQVQLVRAEKRLRVTRLSDKDVNNNFDAMKKAAAALLRLSKNRAATAKTLHSRFQSLLRVAHSFTGLGKSAWSTQVTQYNLFLQQSLLQNRPAGAPVQLVSTGETIQFQATNAAPTTATSATFLEDPAASADAVAAELPASEEESDDAEAVESDAGDEAASTEVEATAETELVAAPALPLYKNPWLWVGAALLAGAGYMLSKRNKTSAPGETE